mmetsp:Transcript_11819/g.34810  ORF Transcript_11819/g.34810 Transcript_11819/m.34810 type:complete len:265 (-) Transcript_11819:87-881(-)
MIELQLEPEQQEAAHRLQRLHQHPDPVRLHAWLQQPRPLQLPVEVVGQVLQRRPIGEEVADAPPLAGAVVAAQPQQRLHRLRQLPQPLCARLELRYLAARLAGEPRQRHECLPHARAEGRAEPERASLVRPSGEQRVRARDYADAARPDGGAAPAEEAVQVCDGADGEGGLQLGEEGLEPLQRRRTGRDVHLALRRGAQQPGARTAGKAVELGRRGADVQALARERQLRRALRRTLAAVLERLASRPGQRAEEAEQVPPQPQPA